MRNSVQIKKKTEAKCLLLAQQKANLIKDPVRRSKVL